MSKKITKIFSFILCFLLLFEQSGFTQVAGSLDISGYLNTLRNSFISDTFRPLHLRYLEYLPENNSFNLLVDKGDYDVGAPLVGALNDRVGTRPAPTIMPSRKIEDATKNLLDYFFIGLTLPNDSFWVNLRPDSPDNIIDDYLAKTDVGRILLESDLQLKKDTAKFTSPQTTEGKVYWDKLYRRAGELFGSDNITIPTLTRPWIVPDEIIIRQAENNAYIYKATLKVMLEEDYLKRPQTVDQRLQTYSFKDERFKTLNKYSSELIRELIIPKLTKEINTSKRYASLRQVYYSLILAQWFKSNYGRERSRPFPTNIVNLIDSKDLSNLTSKTPYSKSTYFHEYQKSFKDGEYNIQEPTWTLSGKSIRSYFSGGIGLCGEISSAMNAGIIQSSSSAVTETLGNNSGYLLGPVVFTGAPGNGDIQITQFISEKNTKAAIASSPVVDEEKIKRVGMAGNEDAAHTIPDPQTLSLFPGNPEGQARILIPEEMKRLWQRVEAAVRGDYQNDCTGDIRTIIQSFLKMSLPSPFTDRIMSRSFTNITAMAHDLVGSLTTLTHFERESKFRHHALTAKISAVGQDVYCVDQHHGFTRQLINAILNVENKGKKVAIVNSDLHHDMGYGLVRDEDLMLSQYMKGEGLSSVTEKDAELALLKNSPSLRADSVLDTDNWIAQALSETSCNLVIQVTPGEKYRKEIIIRRFLSAGKSRRVKILIVSIDILPNALRQARSAGYDTIVDSVDLDSTIGIFDNGREPLNEFTVSDLFLKGDFVGACFTSFDKIVRFIKQAFVGDKRLNPPLYDLNSLSLPARELFNAFFTEEKMRELGKFWYEVAEGRRSYAIVSHRIDSQIQKLSTGLNYTTAETTQYIAEIVSYLSQRANRYYQSYFTALSESGMQTIFHGFALSPDFCPLAEAWEVNFREALENLQRIYKLKFTNYETPVFEAPSPLTWIEGYRLLWYLTTSSIKRKADKFFCVLRDLMLSRFTPQDARELQALLKLNKESKGFEARELWHDSYYELQDEPWPIETFTFPAARPESFTPNNSGTTFGASSPAAPGENEASSSVEAGTWVEAPGLSGLILVNSVTGRIRFNDKAVFPIFNGDLWAVRHGQTYANALGVSQGDIDEDINQLNEVGQQQARLAAEELFAQLEDKIRSGEEIVVITSEGVKRTRDTAAVFIRLVKEKTGRDIVPVANKLINEIDFGIWDNKKVHELDDVQKQLIDRYRKGLDATIRAGGKEAFLDVIRRSEDFLKQINERCAGKTVVLFTHGTFTSALRTFLGDQTLLDSTGQINWRTSNMLPNAKPVLLARNEKLAKPTASSPISLEELRQIKSGEDKVIKEHGMHLFGVPQSAWDNLTEDDKAVFPYLIQVASLYGELYLEQMKKEGGVDNFEITAEMIAQAKDSRVHSDAVEESIVSTTVRGKYQGQDIEIPYCIAYREKLEAIAKIFQEAAAKVKDQETKNFLLAQAEAALWNKWAARDELWLKSLTLAKEHGRQPFGGSQLVYYCGPYEDKARSNKGAFEMAIGIIDPDLTAELLEFKQKTFPIQGTERTKFIYAYRTHVPVISGEGFEKAKTGKNLPNYGDIKEAWGGFNNNNITANNFIFESEVMPILDAICLQPDLVNVSARAYTVIAHELGHTDVRKNSSEIDSLKRSLNNDKTQYYDALSELDATLAWTLKLTQARQVFSDDFRRKIYIAVIIACLNKLLLYLEGFESWWRYNLSEVALINYLVDNGLVIIENGKIKLNIETEDELRVFEDKLSKFSARVRGVFTSGNLEDADELLGDYRKFEVYRPILENIFTSVEPYKPKRVKMEEKFNQILSRSSVASLPAAPGVVTKTTIGNAGRGVKVDVAGANEESALPTEDELVDAARELKAFVIRGIIKDSEIIKELSSFSKETASRVATGVGMVLRSAFFAWVAKNKKLTVGAVKQRLGMPEWAEDLILITDESWEKPHLSRHSALIEEVVHLFMGYSEEYEKIDIFVKEVMESFLELMLYSERNISQMYMSPNYGQVWKISTRLALIHRYRNQFDYNPYVQMREIIIQLKSDIENGESLKIDGEDVSILELVNPYYYSNGAGESKRQSINYLELLLQYEKFSVHKPFIRRKSAASLPTAPRGTAKITTIGNAGNDVKVDVARAKDEASSPAEKDLAIKELERLRMLGYTFPMRIDFADMSYAQMYAAIERGDVILNEHKQFRFNDEQRRAHLKTLWYQGTKHTKDAARKLVFGEDRGHLKWGNLTSDESLARRSYAGEENLVLEFDFSSDPALVLEYIFKPYSSEVRLLKPLPLAFLSRKSKEDIMRRFSKLSEEEIVVMAVSLGLSVGDVHDFYLNQDKALPENRASSPFASNTPGGIDFINTMQVVKVQKPVDLLGTGPLQGREIITTGTVPIVSDQELLQMQVMLDSGITPAPERIKEWLLEENRDSPQKAGT
ncbi:MAG: histidine phosphatase family protein, partial [Candidatus Omnitrophota bacterium]